MILIILEAITERLQFIYDEAGEKKHWYAQFEMSNIHVIYSFQMYTCIYGVVCTFV